MADEKEQQTSTASTHRIASWRGSRVAVLAFALMALVFVIGNVLSLTLTEADGPHTVLIAAALALCVPGVAFYLWTGRSAVISDVSDDHVFCTRAFGIRETRWIGVFICVLLALAFAIPLALGHISGADLDDLAATWPNLIEQRIVDTAFGPGTYVNALLQAGAPEWFPDEMTRGLHTIVSPLALGGEVLWGALFVSLIAYGGVEVGTSSLMLSSLKEPLQVRSEERGEAEDGPVPHDVKALAARVGSTSAVGVQPMWEPGSIGSDRADIMGTLVQSVGLTHVRMGLTCGVIFAVWAALSLVGVMFNLVD